MTLRRALGLLVLGLLAGYGLQALIVDVVPSAAQPYVVMGFALVGLVWAIREARWAGRMKRDIERDIEFLQITGEE